MHKYVIKRLLMLIPVILGITFILYSIMTLTPGDPVRMILGDGATDEAVEQMREELGLNKGFFEGYVDYLKDAAHGDFGKSYRTREPVFNEVFARFPNTLKLASSAIAISIILGVLVGIIQAVHQYSILDNIISGITLICTSIPDFWFGLILIIIFCVNLKLLPASGSDHWYNYVLPAITASMGYTAGTIRLTRSSMLEVIRSDYIRTARAKGTDERTITYRHALKNALLPVVTLIGINLGWQLGGTIIVEQIFAIPGIGTLMIGAVRSKDIPLLMASVTFVAVLSSLINLGTDILYAYIDPRIKAEYSK
ncbi:ABC transporter permease [Lachnospiraceae bacterium NSJ-143]|nr:ABC transporter permease [Lachnospiraceae bacterium NSJ-143]